MISIIIDEFELWTEAMEIREDRRLQATEIWRQKRGRQRRANRATNVDKPKENK